MPKNMITIDGNTAAAHVAYGFSEVAAIYPITPSSTMGELADEWASHKKKNMFGEIVRVVEMQSEAGAAGAIHGSLSAGALTTTFTASQGLLLMLPNMFKIAGELLPTVFHIAARSLAYHSLSIYGDHSDVMAARSTGFAMLASGSVQEVNDLAMVAHLSTLATRVPFLHFFDGFRTSSEVQKVDQIDYATMKTLVDMAKIREFRDAALKPEHPYSKVGAQNPDVYFQGREASNSYYNAVPAAVKQFMAKVKDLTGREYNLFDYVGAPDATKIIVSMGSSIETVEETVKYLNAKGDKVGLVKVRLFRPFSVEDIIKVIPASVRKIAVLDRTKESGAIGEPLYMDVVTALKDRKDTLIIGGRYGLSSKEFTPSMAKVVFDHLDNKAFHSFTVGIDDDVTHLSIPVNEEIEAEPADVTRCMFWGLGSDGTVGANKNSIKIIGESTDMNAQGYFAYDSHKSGGITVSHLRFGKSEIHAPYLIAHADFIALHNYAFIGKYPVLDNIKDGGTFLLNAPWPKEEAFNHLTRDMQQLIIDKHVKFYVIDADAIAKEVGLKGRINTVMQAAFFEISNVLPKDEAIELIKKYIHKTFERKGDEIVQMNWNAVDKASEALDPVHVPDQITSFAAEKESIHDAMAFAMDVISPIIRMKGDSIPVSKMPVDGKVPTGTTRLEKRGVAKEIPHWLSEKCIQCGTCSFVCPHAAIRIKQIEPDKLNGAPTSFNTLKSTTKNERNLMFKVQVFPEDCTGCGLCINSCPKQALEYRPIEGERQAGENANEAFFEALPDNITDGTVLATIKGSQLKKPLFEFSGACDGCGETPYIKLLTQLFGERMIIANATGCTSIVSGTFPTIPYTKLADGRGPAWANSLFEDNAEYGLGMRVAVDANRDKLKNNITQFMAEAGYDTLRGLFQQSLDNWSDNSDAAYQRSLATKAEIANMMQYAQGNAREFLIVIDELQDYLMDKSVWCIGGDGWAYDIGFGGLDHVLASNHKLKILVLDTEVYSNTGGQASKATPMGAMAKFAASGKETTKKNLGLMMMSYGYVYVASVDMGGNRMQVIKALAEAEAYDGPAIVIAYATCINHGITMANGQGIEKRAADSGYWPIYRYNPALAKEGKNPFSFESPNMTFPYIDFLLEETRYKALQKEQPERAAALFKLAEETSKARYEYYKNLASINPITPMATPVAPAAPQP